MALEIHDILRAQGVKRWNIVETVRPQSVAEHSFNVCFIARAIAKEIGMEDEKIIKAALDHDLDEIITGDIPTPAKQRMRKLGFEPDSIHEGRNEYPDNVEDIVGIADMLEAEWFIWSFGVGEHAAAVAVKISQIISRMICDLPVDLRAAATVIRSSIRHQQEFKM